MKTFNTENVTNSKQFVSALTSVMQGISGRNLQLQELLMLAVTEASKLKDDGTPQNNLNWLSMLLVQAEATKGINLTKLTMYVKEVLTCNTTAWDKKKASLKKAGGVDSIMYDIVPSVTWFDYGKKPSIAKEFDGVKTIKNAINNAMDSEKGNMTKEQVLAVLTTLDFSTEDLMNALDINEPTF
tara:strand:+ start:16235 stop:16786 length:552 start_codon:yes stop_codon:yes gene_type:complete